uniref:Uncharacterized protein n=1 Tax=Aegilops tauschii subsp. strangulata TaxID=200361 RepID=A0A453JHN6_AEGTS
VHNDTFKTLGDRHITNEIGKGLPDQIKVLYDLADGQGLSTDDWFRRYALEASLMDIYKSEELFWQRRGGQNWLLKGDANTA